MATIAVTGATDGIGLATARRLLAAGHRVLVHARSEERGRPVVEELGASGGGQAVLVTGDLAVRDEVHDLAKQMSGHGPVDVLVHNAGVWVRGSMAKATDEGLETTFAVNVLAPHLLTGLLSAGLKQRLIWLGSGMAGSGQPDPERFGSAQDARQAYADSKACDVALALVWARRLPHVTSAAVDPGWVETKLASRGAPGHPDESADSLAWCCTDADLSGAPYWKGRRSIPVPTRLRDEALQDAIAAACDRLAGLPTP